MSRPIRRVNQRIIHRNPSLRRQRAAEPKLPWWIDKPQPRRPGRPRHTDKPSSSDRGYGAAHKAERIRWAKLIASGAAPPCARCGRPILPNETFHLDHSDAPDAHRLGIYLGPSHPACNNRAKNVNKNKPQPVPQQTRAKALDDFFGPKPSANPKHPTSPTCL